MPSVLLSPPPQLVHLQLCEFFNKEAQSVSSSTELKLCLSACGKPTFRAWKTFQGCCRLIWSWAISLFWFRSLSLGWQSTVSCWGGSYLELSQAHRSGSSFAEPGAVVHRLCFPLLSCGPWEQSTRDGGHWCAFCVPPKKHLKGRCWEALEALSMQNANTVGCSSCTFQPVKT